MSERYSVYYTSNEALGSIQEREGEWMDFEQAVKWFQHHTTNVAARMGLTVRVIIVDSGDFIVAEWKDGKLVWPKPEDR